MPRTIKIDPSDPGAALAEAVSVLKAGGLVVYPTESFYAIGADALNPEAVKKVFLAKRRRLKDPLPVIIHDKALIGKYSRDLSPEAMVAVERLMPGPVTLVLRASDAFPADLTAGTGKVGIRVPDHAVAAGLAELFGGPVTATSANISGLPGITEAKAAADAFAGSIDLVIDGGRTPGGPPSTILDVTECPPALIREGPLKISRLEQVFGIVATRL